MSEAGRIANIPRKKITRVGEKPFQRRGSKSNAHVGRDFESDAKAFFAGQGLALQSDVAIPIGLRSKKLHRFDLGCVEQRVIVECKSHTWTIGRNTPIAKMTTWNQAMYYFHLAPLGYRKIMFVLRDCHPGSQETLASYYLRTYAHLIPDRVEIWEYCALTRHAECIHRHDVR